MPDRVSGTIDKEFQERSRGDHNAPKNIMFSLSYEYFLFCAIFYFLSKKAMVKGH